MSKLKRLLVYLWAPVANLLWYVYTVLIGIISLALWPFDRGGRMQHSCARAWSLLNAWTIGARLKVSGQERLSPQGCYVYMANHASLIDIPALFACLPYRFHIMAKRELFYVPFLGWHLRAAGHFAIDRSDSRKTARSIRRVVLALREGRSLAVFPEGTRSADGRLKEFKPGAFKIALRARAVIVPVTIRGAHELLPKGSLTPRPGRVDVIIGEPIETAGYSEAHLPELIARTRQAIMKNLLEPALTERKEAGLTAPSSGR
ncbi:MAG TPA: lysophospholipid acyltransferase family protein [Blastocatellia bacterium]|nr:lysophospholipid acyltransferase family protein [Blastocatellia bacterium]